MNISDQQFKEIKNRFGIAGNTDALNNALEMAIRVAGTDITVLLAGESGVGKEVFSKIIHQQSLRKHKSFIAVNCGAIPEGTIDSELFGHEKGAFTSAHDSRKGYFETVNGGTIFLDEIAEMPLNTQSRLLRVLESGEYIRVGSSKVQKTDIRILAATNKDLLDAVKNGKFREDLYYRLSTVTIKIPALRDRANDIPFLFAKFASDASEKYKMPPIELTPGAEEAMKNYRWPGNIRQLKNIIEQISVLETVRTIDARLIEKYLPDDPGEKLKLHSKSNSGSGNRFEGFEERELLYKFLFEIKRDISEVKNFMEKAFGASGNNAASSGAPYREHGEQSTKYLSAPGTRFSEPDPEERDPQEEYVDEDERELVSASGDEGESSLNENFSLEEKEKELIRRALKQFDGKRKVAAKKLGISERTLYRKIKEYQINDV